MSKERLNEVKELTNYIFHEYSKGNYLPWFKTLHKDCVWSAISDPELIGANRIMDYFTNQEKYGPFEIITESYNPLELSDSVYIVTANVYTGYHKTIHVKAQMTYVYKYFNNKPKLVYQNNAYDFLNNSELFTPGSCYKDLTIRLLIKQFAKEHENVNPIAIKKRKQTFYISPLYIVYIQSNKHNTTIYCIDKEIECSDSLTQLQSQLPSYFYNIRRGCMINTKYVVAIRRVEVELVNGATIQVPAPSFTKVKKEIEDMIL